MLVREERLRSQRPPALQQLQSQREMLSPPLHHQHPHVDLCPSARWPRFCLKWTRLRQSPHLQVKAMMVRTACIITHKSNSFPGMCRISFWTWPMNSLIQSHTGLAKWQSIARATASKSRTSSSSWTEDGTSVSPLAVQAACPCRRSERGEQLVEAEVDRGQTNRDLDVSHEISLSFL